MLCCAVPCRAAAPAQNIKSCTAAGMAADLYEDTSCSSVRLLFSVMRTRSSCFCVAESACNTNNVTDTLSQHR